MKQLTTRQDELLQAIATALQEGRHPSTGELLQKLQLANASRLDDLLRPLESKGYVDVQRPGQGQQRRFELTPQGRMQTGFGIPVLGSIPAGPLQEAFQQSDEWLDGAALQPRAGDFLLRVDGDSMTGAGILTGDLVLLRPGIEARNGEIVAAQVSDDDNESVEATLKHLDRLGEQRVRLRAANPNYPDREFDGRHVSIAGVYRGLIREVR